MRAVLLAVASLLAQAPPVAPPVTAPAIVVPSDPIARAKFPHEKSVLIDGFAGLNKAINAAIQPEDDLQHYGIDELWVMFPADRKGDCEDYALTKLGILSMVGFPIVTNAKIVTVMVHHRVNGKMQDDGHAILAIRLPRGEVMYLDNLHDEPMTRRELVRDGYRFSDWVA